MSSAQSIQLGESSFIPLLKMPPKTSSKFALLGYYIRQHLFSYSLGVVAILGTNWIAVSIPEYVRLSIDLLNNDLQVKAGFIVGIYVYHAWISTCNGGGADTFQDSFF